MTKLTNPPKRHIATPHPYTQFCNIYSDKITLPNTIHKKLYDHIHLNTKTPNIQNLQETFSYLPMPLLSETLRCNESITEYTHPHPPILNNQTQPTRPTPLTSQETHAIT